MADLPPAPPSGPNPEPQLEVVRTRGRPLPFLLIGSLVAVVLVVLVVGVTWRWLASTGVPSSPAPSLAVTSSAAPSQGSVPGAITSPSSQAPTPSSAPAAGPSSTSSAPASQAQGTLAVIDAAGGLSTVDDRAGSVVSYAVPGVLFQFPAWSPDGSRIAAIGQAAKGTGVYVFDARTATGVPSDPTVIYESLDRPPFYLYWAPDGRQVTFLTTEPDGIALRIAPADASKPGRTLRQGAPMYWAFMDESRMLVHSGGNAAGAFLGEVGLDGSAAPPAATAPGLFRPPAVSPDGRYRAFTATGAAAAESVVVEGTDGSDHHEIPISGSAAVYFDPTGGTLGFLAADTPGAEAALPVGPLRIVDAASGNVRTLLKGSVVAFFWSPDGKTVAALRLPGPGDDNLADTGHSVVPAVARLPDHPLAAAPAAIGTPLVLVFVDTATGTIRSQRIVALSDTFVYQLLPYFDQYALSHRFWAPDDASIALPTVAEDGSGQVFVFRADGVGARPVADGVIGFWSPQALP